MAVSTSARPTPLTAPGQRTVSNTTGTLYGEPHHQYSVSAGNAELQKAYQQQGLSMWCRM
jgi:hypothetical protein